MRNPLRRAKVSDLALRIHNIVMRVHSGSLALPLPSGRGRPAQILWSPGYLPTRTSHDARPYTRIAVAKFLNETESAGASGKYQKPTARFDAAFYLLQADQLTKQRRSETLATLAETQPVSEVLRTVKRKRGWHWKRNLPVATKDFEAVTESDTPSRY